MSRLSTLALVALVAAACKSKAPEEAPTPLPAEAPSRAVADPGDAPLPTLRSGVDRPEEGRALAGEIVARRSDRGATYLALRLPLQGDESGIDWDRLHVELEGGKPGQVAVIAGTTAGEAVEVLIRASAGNEPAEGTIRGALHGLRWIDGHRRWSRHAFVAAPTEAPGEAPELARRWVEAAGEALTRRSWSGAGAIHPWDHFASGRLRALLDPRAMASAAAADEGRAPRTDLVRLMDTTTGLLSIQEALQHDRGLRIRREGGPRTIAIEALSGPPLAEHPFAAMQAALPDPSAGAPEPLAAAAPADFWYVRTASLPLLLRLLDEADTWITPAVQLLQQNPEDRRLSERYAAELGVERGEIAKILGPVAVGGVALVGSDPYVREGTDVTLLFEVRSPEMYNAELDRYRANAARRHEASGGWQRTSSRVYEGVTIESTRDSADVGRQERALVGEIGLVSNSPRAIERVIDAIAGRRPRLAEGADFRYMRAREGGEAHDVTVFLSDALIAAVVSPAQKIQAARREQALAELLIPGYAALLHGWLSGQAPASREALVKGGLLGADELRHSGGEAIEYEAPRVAGDQAPASTTTRSPWGTPARLTSLLDLPPVTLVSEEEEAAYRGFSGSYQSYWRRFIDPVAVNLDIRPAEGGGEVVDVDVRVLPLIDASDYRELTETVGDARIEVRALGRGLEVVYGVGAESRLRSDLDGILRGATGKPEIGIGWVGEWVMIGIEDRAALADLYVWLEDRIQIPDRARPEDVFRDDELWRRVGRAPVYAAADVRNGAALVATLGAIRTMSNEIAPGTVEWGEHSRYRDQPIVRVGVRRDAPLVTRPELADALALYYAQTKGAIVLAVDPEVLHPVLDRLLAGEAPKPGAADGAQLVFESASAPGQALWTVGSWLLQAEAMSAQTVAERGAEILLQGTPGGAGEATVPALGLAYFGAIPLSARGEPPTVLSATGAADPIFGTAIARTYPALPIDGSPIALLMQRLRGVRVEVSFDREPAAAGVDARSLHTHLQLRLGG